MKSSSPLGDAKRQWRREILRRLQTVSPEHRLSHSHLICQKLRARPEWQRARCVLLFYSMALEPDVLPLWEVATTEGKQVAFPSFLPGTRRYAARAVEPWHPAVSLPTGAFGIPEPPPSALLLEGNQLDFVVVPGVGFAPDGRRLGRGGGYYDRLLTDVKGFRCGVAFDEQLVDDLPTEPHDIRCDCILTPSRECFCPRARM